MTIFEAVAHQLCSECISNCLAVAHGCNGKSADKCTVMVTLVIFRTVKVISVSDISGPYIISPVRYLYAPVIPRRQPVRQKRGLLPTSVSFVCLRQNRFQMLFQRASDLRGVLRHVHAVDVPGPRQFNVELLLNPSRVRTLAPISFTSTFIE